MAKGRSDEESGFEESLEAELDQTEGVAQEAVGADPASIEAASWHRAREMVAAFKPVPGIVWRIANFVLGKSGEIRTLSEGGVYGLRNVVCAIASDKTIGAGETVTSIRRALEVAQHDVIAAGAVMHAICRRLAGRDFQRIWRPILDDAVLRAGLGYMVGERCPEFGCGRGMLAGFTGRSGLVVLIACGTMDQAREALEALATGRDIAAVGMKVYGCNPLQVSAMLLSASGVGKDAAFGSVSYALRERAAATLMNKEQGRWLAAFAITEALRMNRPDEIGDERWAALDLVDPQDQKDIIDRAKPLLRKGVEWGWL
ncbi:MAG: hypothetical protein RL417_1292 [Pseudomonadota bacterium]